jgi:hypothetical protein
MLGIADKHAELTDCRACTVVAPIVGLVREGVREVVRGELDGK